MVVNSENNHELTTSLLLFTLAERFTKQLTSSLDEQTRKLLQFSNENNNKGTFLSSEGSYEADPDYVRLKRLLEVENLLVNEYVGDMRTKVNAMTG